MLSCLAATCENETAMLLRRCVHRLAIVASLSLVVLTSCAETPRTATNFCRVLADRIDEMTEPPTDNASVNRLIDHYTRLAEVAPIEVEEAITTLRDLFVAASQVNVNDPESVQAVADLAYQADGAAEAAGIYAGATCGVDLSTGFAVEVPDSPAAVPESSATTLAP
jgi:hypothetical protein